MESRWVIVDANGDILRTLGCQTTGKFSYERDLSTGLIAFRKKLTADLSFTGDDYTYFRAIERRASRRCEEIIIRRDYFCKNKWWHYWTGTFSVNSGKWDYTRCEFTVRPEVFDRYTCILRSLDRRVNVLDVAPTSIDAVVFPSSIEFATCDLLNLANCASIYDAGAGWELAHTWFDATLGRDVRLYWRERVFTECVAGAPVPPPGSGWILLYNNCDGSWPYGECPNTPLTGQAVYVRQPTISYTFGDPVRDPDETCLFQAYAGADYNGNPNANVCTDNSAGNIYVCLGNGDTTTYSRARTVLEILEYMLEKSGCTFERVVSDFFEWNPAGDADGYVAGENYVTGAANQVDELMLIQNSDAIDPAASNPATRGEMTLKELLVLFVQMFRVYWDIDDDNQLRIEHWKYWTSATSLDLTTYASRNITDPLSHSSLNIEIPRYEKFKFSHGISPDILGLDIIYSGPCVSSEDDRQSKDVSVRITTDLSYIATTPDAISKEGFTMVATNDGSVILDLGAITSTYVTNAPLGWSNLHRDFFTWDRYLSTGNMNGQDVEFDGVLPNRQQGNVSVRICCSIISFDPRDRVLTNLGTRLGGITSEVKKADWEDRSEWINLTLQFPY